MIYNKRNEDITMTKEEAISIIENKIIPGTYWMDWIDALNVALFIMRGQEWAGKIKCYREQRPCKDCISREAVNTLVNELAIAISDERCYISRGRSTTNIMQDIFELPPVTPARPEGKWIKGVCNYCNYDWGKDAPIASVPNFCPSCGADMRECFKKEDISYINGGVEPTDTGNIDIIDAINM